jgi:GAF domain-containing protein
MTAPRLRKLQQASAALARALDEGEIARELGRGALGVLGADGVFVVQPDLQRGAASVMYAESGGMELTAGQVILDNGAISLAARTGEWTEAYGVEAETLLSADPGLLSTAPAGSMLVGPVVHGRRLLAVLGVSAGTADPFESEAVDAVRMLASQAGMALSHASLFKESERERREIEAMAEAARAVGGSLRMGEVVRLVLRHAIGLLRGEGACVTLREGNYLNVVAAVGVADLMAGVHLPLHGSIAGRAVQENTAVIVNDVSSDPSVYRPALRFANLHQAIVVPLSTWRGPLGSLSVFNRADGFGIEDARVLQRLADHVAVAIVNARLFEEVTEATRAWTSTFDSIGVGLAIVDDAGRIIRYNSRARQLALGEGRAELAGLPFYEAILGGATVPNDGPVERALRDGVMVRVTIDVPGSERRLQLTAAPHLDRGAIVTFDWAGDAAE